MTRRREAVATDEVLQPRRTQQGPASVPLPADVTRVEPSPISTVRVVASDLAAMTAERDRLREQRNELHARGTTLVLERRRLDWTAQVHELFRAFEQPIPDAVGWPDEATLKLRRKLIVEETGETLDAIKARDFPEFVDGCIDSIVVLLGALVACGVDPRPVWDAVQAANLTKAGGPISSDGKRMKPPGFVPPDVAGIVRAQGWKP